MRRSLIALPVLLAAVAVFLGADAHAAPPADPGRSEHERIVRYWTPDRVEHARPREIERAAPQAPQAKPGGGGGGSGTSTGAYWTKGGLVKKTTGRVLFTLSGVDYVCSGSAVADARTDASLVLTAGHCVFDDAKDVFATNWMFVPDYETGGTFTCAQTAYGCWTAQALVTTAAWSTGDFNEDYAFAVLRPGGKDGATQLDAAVGTQSITFTVSPVGQAIYAFGYPAAQKYDGQRLAYCNGTAIADSYGSTDGGLACDMTGGSSGGPWFTGFNASTGVGTLTSVNSFKYRGLSTYMWGPFFDAYGAKAYGEAQTATANTLVTAP